MIYLTKGQPLFDNPSFVVYDQSGYYNDGDTVICSSVGAPEDPVCRYEAKYIAYGGIVYSISDPDALLAEVMKIDPKSLYGKDSQQVAIDNAVSAIVPNESGQITDTPTPEVAIPDTPIDATTTPETIVSSTSETPFATTTPDIMPPDTTNISTTTPDVVPVPPPAVEPDSGLVQ